MSNPISAVPEPAVVVERRQGPYGEVVLRRRGPHYEIIANGCFLMDTSDGRSERLLVRAALDELAGRARPQLLIGGLGVGFSLAEAASEPRWARITVVEREPAILDWHRTGPLSAVCGQAQADPRTELVEADLVAYLHESAAAGRRFDALCLDIDNGPDWTVTDDNAALYSPAGLAACREALAPGGVLAVWSAQPSPTFEGCLSNTGFCRVRTDEIPVARGVPDVVHFAARPA
ncbi:spermidine synthase [Streptomyces sp. CA-250714]|uniref:spermidine synthase n=1 Tax=Streptomyces sp. CA-250714 TaxID=3240060 RepID=UPI003D8AE5EA